MMLTRPSGSPGVAMPPRDFNWDRVQRDVSHLIHDTEDNAAKLGEWRSWIDTRPRTLEDASDIRFASQLPAWDLPMRPGEPVRQQSGPGGLSQWALVYDHPRCVTSSVGTGADGAAARRMAARARAENSAETAATRRDALSPGDFVFARANWTNTDGFQIPLILVQLPDGFDGKDTSDENLKLKPKWSVPLVPLPAKSRHALSSRNLAAFPAAYLAALSSGGIRTTASTRATTSLGVTPRVSSTSGTTTIHRR